MSTGLIETTIFRTDEEVRAFVRDFKSGALPRERWTHHAHLVVALWYVHHFKRERAVSLVRARIKRYNKSHGIANTPDSGYHETITRFWLRMVHNFHDASAARGGSLAALANELPHRFADKNLPLSYYSRERLMSSEARAMWVRPDKTKISAQESLKRMEKFNRRKDKFIAAARRSKYRRAERI